MWDSAKITKPFNAYWNQISSIKPVEIFLPLKGNDYLSIHHVDWHLEVKEITKEWQFSKTILFLKPKDLTCTPWSFFFFNCIPSIIHVETSVSSTYVYGLNKMINKIACINKKKSSECKAPRNFKLLPTWISKRLKKLRK